MHLLSGSLNKLSFYLNLLYLQIFTPMHIIFNYRSQVIAFTSS